MKFGETPTKMVSYGAVSGLTASTLVVDGLTVKGPIDGAPAGSPESGSRRWCPMLGARPIASAAQPSSGTPPKPSRVTPRRNGIRLTRRCQPRMPTRAYIATLESTSISTDREETP